LASRFVQLWNALNELLVIRVNEASTICAMSIAALLVAAAVSSAAPQPEPAHRVELAEAQVQAVILKPAFVRQGSGPEVDADGPAPQITRRVGTVLVEYQ
jgi:hypothetical protein